ncbi:DUF4345 family protein [Amycolatopsis sp. NPDC005232]|uniref:DUF4345 family protein n=1 Tax=unclassified Amycolatopsis TaxID=2618356 RepID=UPI0021051837|nr:DUF4345 family protein [Amycolatopsis sp. DSM 110486]
MHSGQISSLGLLLSGVASVVAPGNVADTLRITAADPRGTTEIRAGLGGTYAALGGWALASKQPAADVAVGATWLGAAAVRLGSLALDRPKTDASYWAFLGLEVGLGSLALLSARSRRRARRQNAGQPSRA